jgi:hypothetical protein
VIEVEAPDGTIVEFPEGMSMDQIRNVMRNRFGGPAQRTVDDVAADVAATPIGGVQQGGPRYSVPRGEISAAAPWTRQLGESPIRGAATILPAAADLVTGVANFGLNAGARGLASLFGAEPPADVDISTNLRGATNRGFDAAASAVGLTPTRPEQRTTALYGAGEGVGSTLPVSAGLRVAGTLMAPREATTRMGQVGEQILNNYRYAPGRTLTADAAAGAGAGAAGQLAQDSGMGAVGTAGAALLGGTAAGLTAGRLLNGGGTVGTAILDRLAPGRMDPPGGPIPVTNPATGLPRMAAPGEIRDAAGLLQLTARDPARAASNIESGAATFRAGGLTPPTTSALSDDPRLALFERARRNADATGDFRTHDQQVDTGIARAVESPQGAVSANRAPARQAFEAARDAELAGPQRAIDQARDAIPPAQQNMQVAEAAAQGQRDILSATPTTASEASRRLDDILVNQTLRPKQQTRTDLYNEIKNKSGDISVDAAPVADALKTVRDQISVLRSPASTLDQSLAGRIDTLADNPNGLRVRDVVDALPDIAKLRTSARNAGQYDLADNLGRLQTSLKDTLRGVTDPDAARAIQAAFDFENNTFALFRRGEIGALRDDLNAAPRLPDGTLDRNATPPSDTLERFWSTQKGAAEKAADLESFIAASPDPAGATEAISNYVMTDLASRVVGGTGQVDPGIVRQMIFDYQNAGLFNGPAGQQARGILQQTLTDVMSSNTTLTQARSTLDDTVRQLTEAQSRLAGVRDQIRTGPLGLVLDANGLGSDPLKAAAAIRNSPDPVGNMRAVTEIAARHGKKSLEAWRASVGRELYESVLSGNSGRTTADGPLPVDFGSYLTAFERNREMLSAVMAPEQMNVLNLVAKIMKPLQSVRMTGAQGSQTVQNSNLQTFFRVSEITLKSVYGGLTGGNMFRNMKLSMQSLGLLSENPAVTQIIQRSFFDPELAAYLYRSNPEMPVSGHTAFLRRFFALSETTEEE